MSFTPNSNITSSPVEHIRCQQHAARTFVDDSFRLLPKNKFLFHVAFNINWPAVRSKTDTSLKLLETLKDEINLLVKSIELPAYTVQHEVLNQYNRKRVVQYQHKYNEVGVSFNDDNMGLVNQLWQAYYKYYYADPIVSNAKGAYNKTATKPASFITNPYGYNGRIAAFFNYITIYQMSRHEFVSYKLINPVITSWTGGKMAYNDYGSHHFDMKFAYESVYYDTGFVDSGKMEGFGTTHYDWTPSPLSSNYPRNVSSSPTFSRTSFGSTDTTVTTDTKLSTTGITSTKASPLLYQSISLSGATASGTNTGSSVQGVSIPQTTSATSTTSTTGTTASQVTMSSTSSTTATGAVTGVKPDYASAL